MIAIGGYLEDERSVLRTVLGGEAGGLTHRQDVHPVHVDAGHVVAALVELRRGSVPVLPNK